MRIDEILLPGDVSLALRADDKSAAIEEILGPLRGDTRVGNWERLRAAVVERDAPALKQDGIGICIAHGRTDAVSGLVMAAGRSAAGVAFPGATVPVRLIFAVGIPSTMNSEYLRLVGAIARVCRVPEHVDNLLAAENGDAFVERLSAASARL